MPTGYDKLVGMLQRGFTPEAISESLHRQKPPETPAVKKKAWITWETGVTLLKVGTQVGYAVYKHQQFWCQLDGRVLAAARENQGWLSQADLLAAVDYRAEHARKVSDRLVKQGVCRVLIGRHGHPVYLFESLMPPRRLCEYCDQPRQGHRSCCQCGAP